MITADISRSVLKLANGHILTYVFNNKFSFSYDSIIL